MNRFLCLLFALGALCAPSFAESDSIRETWPSTYSLVTQRAKLVMKVTWGEEVPAGVYYIGAGAGIPGQGAQPPWVWYGFIAGGTTGGGQVTQTVFYSCPDIQVTQGVTVFQEIDFRGISCQNGPGTLFPISGGRIVKGECKTGPNSTSPVDRNGMLPDKVVNLDYHIGSNPAKHPEPLNFTIENKSKNAIQFLLRNPSGTTVFQGGCGSNQSMATGWDPPDNAAEGVYTLFLAATDASGGQAVFSVSSDTLSAANAVGAKSIYSKAWGVGMMAGAMNGTGDGIDNGLGGGTGINGKILNNDTGPHLLEWRDPTGKPLASAGTVGPGSGLSVDPLADGLTTPPGTQLQATLFDKTTGKPIGEVSLMNPGDNRPTIVSGNITAVIGPPTPAPGTPSPTQTNQGNQSTGTQTNNPATNTQTTVVNNGSSTTITNQDMYNNMKQAIQDATQSMSASSGPPTDHLDGREAEQASGKRDEIAAKMDSAKTSATEVQNKMQTYSQFTSWVDLPSGSLGTASHIDFGTLNFGSFGSISMDYNIGGLAGAIAQVRSILLWLLNATFVGACIWAVWDSFTK